MSLREKIEGLTRYEPEEPNGRAIIPFMAGDKTGRYLDRAEVLALVEEHEKGGMVPPEAMSLLHDLYRDLWCEAVYDPTNESTQKFAAPLADKMRRLNALLGFKK